MQSSGIWQAAGVGMAWLVAISLMVAGLIGCVIPVLPGHLIILIGALAYRLMLGPAGGLSWGGLVVLVLLMVISQVFEWVSGAAGSKWFGGSRWGAVGAILGSIVGLFFMPFGLLLGPLIGAFSFEIMFARKQTAPAVVSGVGSVFGTLAGMICKIAVGVAMIGWFFADVFWVGQ
jgi:uncharacterized protein YqgC (DUF456 family)